VVLLSDSDLLLTRHGVHDWNRMLLGPDLVLNSLTSIAVEDHMLCFVLSVMVK
jgi:hypothetical protein